MSEEENKGNGEAPAAAQTDSTEAGAFKLHVGFHTEINQPLVIVEVGNTKAALDTRTCRELAVQMIGVALISEQEAAKRHAPVLAQVTAAAMQAVNKRH